MRPAGGATTRLVGPQRGTAVAINNAGDVSGSVLNPATSNSQPVVWRSGGDLVRLPTAGTRFGLANGINDNGTVAGYSYTPFFDSRLTVWNPDGTAADTLENAAAFAIDNAGVVVGRTIGAPLTSARGFTWIPGRRPVFLPGDDALALDINAAGDMPEQCLHPRPSTQLYGDTHRASNRDSGETWDFVANVPNKPGPSQNFYWTVTGAASAHARLRVTAVGDEGAADENDADVRIAPAAISFILPSRATAAQIGTTQTIFFSHNLGAEKPFAIAVSGDSGRTWRTSLPARSRVGGHVIVPMGGRPAADDSGEDQDPRAGWHGRDRSVGGVCREGWRCRDAERDRQVNG